MNLGDRLRHLIEEKKVTAYEVALKTGISQATLSRVLNDNTAKMSIKTIDVLTQYFNIKKDWLASGIGEKAEILDVAPPQKPTECLECVKLKSKIEYMAETIEDLKAENAEIKIENKHLIRDNGSLENQVSSLNRELDKYRRKKTE